VTQPDQKKLILSISPVNAWRRSPSSLPRLNETKLWTNRNALLLRDRYKCRYCSFESKPGRGGLHIHHVDRNPRNNRTNNLETVCAMCHLILHAGYASQVVGVLDLYSTSNRTQNEVVTLTRTMRAQRASDGQSLGTSPSSLVSFRVGSLRNSRLDFLWMPFTRSSVNG
jgi:hypothetical protein